MYRQYVCVKERVRAYVERRLFGLSGVRPLQGAVPNPTAIATIDCVALLSLQIDRTYTSIVLASIVVKVRATVGWQDKSMYIVVSQNQKKP